MTKPDESFRRKLSCMANVVRAIYLRETVSMYGDTRLGYIWCLMQTVFGILIFAFIRYFTGTAFHNGLPIVYFLLSGFLIYNIFGECVGKCLRAIDSNGALLQFPHVEPLDLMLARCLLVILTHVTSAIIIIAGASALGFDFHVTDTRHFIFTLAGSFYLAVSSAIFVASVNVFYPTLGNIFSYVNRILFFISGIFFSVERFPTWVQEICHWNPLYVAIHNLRFAITDVFSVNLNFGMAYVYEFSTVLIVLGLLLEHASHRRME